MLKKFTLVKGKSFMDHLDIRNRLMTLLYAKQHISMDELVDTFCLKIRQIKMIVKKTDFKKNTNL